MNDYSPIIKQYLAIKEDYPDAIVFFRLGDFYEMFFDDAIVASKVLEIALTKKNKNEKIPMCGVPYHAVKAYLQKLINNDFKVVIVEQFGEPGKGLVERYVTRIITKGTILEDEILDPAKNNYLASLVLCEFGYTMSFVDISTGEAAIYDSLMISELIELLKVHKIKEVIIKTDTMESLVDSLKKMDILVSYFDDSSISNHKAIANLNTSGRVASSLLINYLNNIFKIDIKHLQSFQVLSLKKYLKLSNRERKSLELEESLSNEYKSTLFSILDATRTRAGKRKLHQFLENPLYDKNAILERYDYVDGFLEYELMDKLGSVLDNVHDINRIISKINYNTLSPRDLINLKDTLVILPKLVEILSSYKSEKVRCIGSSINLHEDLVNELEKSIDESSPFLLKDGGVIKEGYNSDLDELRLISQNGKKYIDNYLQAEKERTKIDKLKIGYNHVFGYFLEVTNSLLPLVKDEFLYIRRQTLTNCERYTTIELKKLEDLIINSNFKSLTLENSIFKDVLNFVSKYQDSLQNLAYVLANIDVYLAFAKNAIKYNYTRPIINDSNEVTINDARHPVVERETKYISNNIKMKKGEIFLITGPNMAGKSTYMRSMALIVIMAQIGSFVPASYANLGLYDAIYTRIGSSDELISGKSTFMVEMLECNYALNNATSESLLIFDEIGRGTSTYDGISLAYGIINYVNKKIHAHTFFSTHYHELISFLDKDKNFTFLFVKAITSKDTISFLHKVEYGISDRSYGILVAKLAGLPDSLLKVSNKVLEELENKDSSYDKNLFNVDVFKELDEGTGINLKIVDEILNISTDNITPFDALLLLKNYQNRLKNK
ncbi:MAG: DNA mismatch repair protein MutS [Acholeplasmatales bacterium]|jgi:DNA mismatch repair protein MutS|nr:DNA mismatch repair protein MutS [Acholeplasmatales bacterium]